METDKDYLTKAFLEISKGRLYYVDACNTFECFNRDRTEYESPLEKIALYSILEALKGAAVLKDKDDIWWLLKEPFQEEYLRPFSLQWCCYLCSLDPISFRNKLPKLIGKYNQRGVNSLTKIILQL